jgi:hypothetical protein
MRTLIKKDIIAGSGLIIGGAVIIILAMIFSALSREKFADLIIPLFVGFSGAGYYGQFSDDDKSKYIEYALTLPITRHNIVDVKYIEALLLWVIFLIVEWLNPAGDRTLRTVVPSTMLIAFALVLPFVFKYGGRGNRIVAIGTGISLIAPFIAALAIGDHPEHPLAILYPVAGASIIISWLISRKVIMTRDF